MASSLAAWIAPLLVPCALSACPARTAAPPAATPALEARAREFLQLLVQRKYDEAHRRCSPVMAGAMPRQMLQQVWEKLQHQVGAYQRVAGTRQEEVSGFRVVVLTTHFAKTPLEVRVTVSAEGMVDGLYFRPAAPQAPAAALPPYARAGTFAEREVAVGDGEWRLPGTLTLPQASRPPAVVLVHGSGPQDRDETIGPNRPFRDLALGLGSRGIAVLRYEKRTRVHAAKLRLEGFTLHQETVEDALAAVALLRRMPEIDPSRLFVLGHSLGGMALPRIGHGDTRIAGLIFMAATSRPLEDVVVEQLRYIASLDGKASDEARQQIVDAEAAAAAVKSARLATTPAAKLPFSIPAAYWLDLRAHDPLHEVKTLRQRLLLLQGGRDYQVTLKDLDGWRRALAGRADVVVKVFPKGNHLLAFGEGRCEPAEYLRAAHVAAPVIEEIATFIKLRATGQR
jgi:uncharacterized protein